MLTRHPFWVVPGFVLVATCPTLVIAQVRLEFGPLAALYAPQGSFQPASYYTTWLPNSPSDLTGLAWGGEARLWFARRLGVQLQAAEAFSSVGGGITPRGPVAAMPARVFTLTTQALYNVYSAPERARVWLSAGAGLVRHGGAAYARYGTPIQVTGVLGLGYATPIRRRLNATLGITTMLYSFDLRDSTGTSLERGFQTDALLHVGLTWGWP